MLTSVLRGYRRHYGNSSESLVLRGKLVCVCVCMDDPSVAQAAVPSLFSQTLMYCVRNGYILSLSTKKTKLRGLSPHANYTDRAAAAGRRS